MPSPDASLPVEPHFLFNSRIPSGADDVMKQNVEISRVSDFAYCWSAKIIATFRSNRDRGHSALFRHPEKTL
jgi:hypothetical protein